MVDTDVTLQRRLRARLGGIAFGGDYNPEQWPAATRAEDLRLMREAGVNLVTLGVFGWARVQPAPDRYDFSLYDQVMDELAEAGITVDLATMTASPPPWLTHRYPQILPVTADGVRLSPGGRQHYCPSSTVYREHAASLVEALAGRYGEHPALGLWHVGNEYGCHVARCFCDGSAEDFRRWLRSRYGDIDALNEAWSTEFWSQRYSAFEQVLPPRTAPTYPNPSQHLDFKRFSDAALRECYLTERRVLRRLTPAVPVTTNLVAALENVDFAAWAPHMDVAALDAYLDPADRRGHLEVGVFFDAVRGARGGEPWLLMEHAPSAVNWRARNAAKRPGQLRLHAWHALARGADSVMYFQWRQSRGGAEKFHSGMVPHAGADTRVFREVRALGRELAAVPELAGTRVTSQTAVLLDWNSWWALELDSHPSDGLRQVDRLLDHYAPLCELGLAVDVVAPSADLSAYRLVVAPNLYLLSVADAARITEYVRAGGNLVVSFFSGIVDECDRVHLGGYPAPLRDVLGVRVQEFQPAAEGETFDVTDVDGHVGVADLWREDLHLAGAEAETVYREPHGPGGVAAGTVHRFGVGIARYLATRLDPAMMRASLARAARDAGVRPVVHGLPPGVQAGRRTGDGHDFLILLNHGDEPREVVLATPRDDAPRDSATGSAAPRDDAPWYDALRGVGSGREPVRVCALGPGGVAVLRRSAP